MPDLAPIARTAFYCCALRAADAASARPVCGDVFAARFLDDATLSEMQPLLRFRGPSASNVARHRLIDDLVRRSVEEEPARRTILLGAGFDTRAFRLAAGRWWEIDDANILAFKEERLPAKTAPNPLETREHPRVAIEAAGYRPRHMASIVGRARDAGTVQIPRWLLNTLLRELRDGYAVWEFEPIA
ncbi:MAG: class I SAM-dependent methyltransferase [Planctomycetaceae bacterium]